MQQCPSLDSPQPLLAQRNEDHLPLFRLSVQLRSTLQPRYKLCLQILVIELCRQAGVRADNSGSNTTLVKG